MEAARQIGIGGDVAAQHLERDRFAEVRLLGEIDAAHSAGREQLLHAKLLADEATDEPVCRSVRLLTHRPHRTTTRACGFLLVKKPLRSSCAVKYAVARGDCVQ